MLYEVITGEVLHTVDVDNRLKTSKPYKKWLKENSLRLENTSYNFV